MNRSQGTYWAIVPPEALAVVVEAGAVEAVLVEVTSVVVGLAVVVGDEPEPEPVPVPAPPVTDLVKLPDST